MDEINWNELFEMWLISRESPSTRRSYTTHWEQLLEFNDKKIGEIKSIDIVRWIADLKERGLAPKTIRQYLYGISSYYGYINGFLDQKVPNPVDGVKKPVGKNITEPYFLNPEEAGRMLQAVDRSTVLGKRDYALILFYIATGRRNSEVRRLKWGDFEQYEDRMFYRWTGKWNSCGRHECPKIVYDAIIDYLEFDDRLIHMHKDCCIFPSMTDETKPISSRQVGRIVKRYAGFAGLDTERIHTHSLRHTAAMLRLTVGDDVGVISKMLGHTKIMHTQFYLHQLAGSRIDRSWDKVADLLKIDE